MSKIALIQMRSGAKVKANLQDAAAYIAQAAALGARLAVLPENFALMASETQRRDIAEAPGAGQLQDYRSEQERNNGIWLVAGTIPLLDNDNESADRPPAASCLVIDSDGR